MPKMKSHRGAAKRIEITSTGKIRRRRAFGNHFLGKKSASRKRHIDSPGLISGADEKRIRRMLGK